MKNQEDENDTILVNVLGYVQFAYEERNLYQLMFAARTLSMNQTGEMVKSSDTLTLNMMIYANGLIMMNVFGTIDLSWEKIRKMIIEAYDSFKK